jgi:hypothetical protein
MALSKMANEEDKYIDLLDEDKTITGQKFVCMSFISPEKIIKNKELFYFNQFLNKWDFQTSMNKFDNFLQFMSSKYTGLDINILQNDFKDFVSSEYDDLIKNDVTDDYKLFIETYQDKLNEKFEKENNFQTSVRGLKIRGSFNTQEEAELRCKMIRTADPNHDVFVGPIGIWIPWDPEAYKTGRVEYMEEELNKLMHEKNKNETAAKSEFDERVTKSKKDAIESNIKIAKQTGNLLTQSIDEDGNLVGVDGLGKSTVEATIDTNNTGDNLNENVKNELFNYENIREIETTKEKTE